MLTPSLVLSAVPEKPAFPIMRSVRAEYAKLLACRVLPYGLMLSAVFSLVVVLSSGMFGLAVGDMRETWEVPRNITVENGVIHAPAQLMFVGWGGIVLLTVLGMGAVLGVDWALTGRGDQCRDAPIGHPDRRPIWAVSLPVAALLSWATVEAWTAWDVPKDVLVHFLAVALTAPWVGFLGLLGLVLVSVGVVGPAGRAAASRRS